jgi:hypothetical protein
MIRNSRIAPLLLSLLVAGCAGESKLEPIAGRDIAESW